MQSRRETVRVRGRSRPSPLALTLALFAALGVPGAAAAGPNVLLILTDNTGWGDWGAYGGGALRGAPSPRIDALAAQGVRLQNFNTEPQCTPSRSALMTGRHAIRSGTHSVPIGVPYYGLVPWEVTLAEAFAAKGFATGLFGKWHLGKTPGRLPTDQGFDEFYGILNSTDEVYWTTAELMEEGSVPEDVRRAVPEREIPHVWEGRRGRAAEKLAIYDLEQRRRIDGEATRRSIAFMERHAKAGRSFFAYVPLTATHYPTVPHPDFAGRSGHGGYTDMLVQTDHYVGEMLDALDRLGVGDDTIVIFAADNGPEDPDNGDGRMAGWTGPWAGTYFTAMEGGLRAPFLIRWPKRIPAGMVSNEIVHIVDVFPTLAAFADLEVPDDRPVDGVDQSAFLLGKTDRSAREGFLVYVGSELHAAKWRNWKWHLVWQPTKYEPMQRFSTVPKIVNLIRDPREERQVAEPFNTWTQFPFMDMLLAFEASQKQAPHVPMAAPDSYRP
jgi:arylsulfatase